MKHPLLDFIFRVYAPTLLIIGILTALTGLIGYPRIGMAVGFVFAWFYFREVGEEEELKKPRK